MDIQQLAANYEGKSDDELLRLALDPNELTTEANMALQNEIARRKIRGAEQLARLREEEQQRLEEESKKSGKAVLLHPYGIGRQRFGKANRSCDPNTKYERSQTTAFIVLFWFPLIPTGTYLVEKERSFFSRQERILKKMPLDWEQVLKVWVAASAALLWVMWLFKLLHRFLY